MALKLSSKTIYYIVGFALIIFLCGVIASYYSPTLRKTNLLNRLQNKPTPSSNAPEKFLNSKFVGWSQTPTPFGTKVNSFTSSSSNVEKTINIIGTITSEPYLKNKQYYFDLTIPSANPQMSKKFIILLGENSQQLGFGIAKGTPARHFESKIVAEILKYIKPSAQVNVEIVTKLKNPPKECDAKCHKIFQTVKSYGAKLEKDVNDSAKKQIDVNIPVNQIIFQE